MRRFHGRWTLVALTVLFAVSTPGVTAFDGGTGAARAAASPTFDGYLTIVLGRALYAKTGSCTSPPVIPVGMMSLDQVVSGLASMGVGVTAAVVPSRTLDSGMKCVNGDLYPNWTDLGSLRDVYGLTVVSASQNYVNMTTLSSDQQFQQSCGSLGALIAHGHHRAWGLFAYPNNKYTSGIQSDVVSNCFAFGRTYKTSSDSLVNLTNYQSTMGPPWLEVTVDVGGGRCRDTTQPCNAPTPNKLGIYASPQKLSTLTRVGTGSWRSLQFYSFVTDKNLSGPLQWDCTGASWMQHWTSRFEVYCWNDLIYALGAKPSTVVVTDPTTVAEAWGRIPTPLVVIDSSPSSVSASTAYFDIQWHSPENGTYKVLVGGTDCSSGSQVTSGSNTNAPSPVITRVATSFLSPGSNTIRICLTNDALHQGATTTTVTEVS